MTIKRHFLLSILLASVVACVVPQETPTQTRRRLSSTDKAFQVFFVKFRTAVVRKSKSAVASLTKFPFKYGFDAGDEGAFSRSQFISRFNDIFDGQERVFRLKDPMFFASSGRFELVNEDDASHFIFRKVSGTYKFVSFMSEP